MFDSLCIFCDRSSGLLLLCPWVDEFTQQFSWPVLGSLCQELHRNWENQWSSVLEESRRCKYCSVLELKQKCKTSTRLLINLLKFIACFVSLPIKNWVIGNPSNDTKPDCVAQGDNPYCPEFLEPGWDWLDQSSKKYFLDKTAKILCTY